MKGTFIRISPAQFAEKVGIPASWFVISWRWIPDKSQRRRAHGSWYMIAALVNMDAEVRNRTPADKDGEDAERRAPRLLHHHPAGAFFPRLVALDAVHVAHVEGDGLHSANL